MLLPDGMAKKIPAGWKLVFVMHYVPNGTEQTDQTRIEGAGTVNLREEKQDFELVPRPKSAGLFTLGSSIHVGGTFKHPAVDFHKGRAGAPAIASTAHCPTPATLAAAR